jgi:segregation and condensation protein A
MEFNVKLERFEGPYTKLLDLIAEHKLSITEVSLASIADEYIAYVKTLEHQEAVDISQFILVASTLMLIKARSLLPTISFTPDEEKQVHQLEKKLELYELLRGACNKIQSVYLHTQLYNKPRAPYKEVIVFVPSESLTQATLHSIAFLTLATFKPSEKLKSIYIEQAIRIETVIENILDRVQKATTVSLASLAHSTDSIVEKKKVLIVNFIALLELMKNGAVSANQEDGGDIFISPISV